jgi:hypothetical protein
MYYIAFICQRKMKRVPLVNKAGQMLQWLYKKLILDMFLRRQAGLVNPLYPPL